MFSKKEKRFLKDKYFILIRDEETYIEFMSNNTSHCWIIQKSVLSGKIKIYHKHRISDCYYHFHYSTNTIGRAIVNIKKHDKYVLDNKM